MKRSCTGFEISGTRVATAVRGHPFTELSIMILGIIFLSYGSQVLATTTLAWSESPLTITVMAGTSTSVSVELEASSDLSDVALSVGPALTSFVSVYPTTLPTLVAGAPQTVSLGISIPADTLLDTYEGTLHVKQGKRTLASPLPLSVEVVEATVEHVPPGVALPSSDRIVIDPVSGKSVVSEELEVFFYAGTPAHEVHRVIEFFGGVFLGSIPALDSYQVRFRGYDLDGLRLMRDALTSQESVESASFHLLHDFFATPQDPAFGDPDKTWGQRFISLPEAWDITTGRTCSKDSPVSVGIIDSGFYWGHEEFAMMASGTSDKGQPNPILKLHGTSVAGIVGAEANNGKGTAGVLWDGCIRLYSSGVATWTFPFSKPSDMKTRDNAIVAIGSGARVLNFSFGSIASTAEELENWLRPWRNIVKWARIVGHNTLFVFAVPNKEVDLKLVHPASLANDVLLGDDVIAVTAIARTGTFLRGSGYGDGVTVAAPGEDIYSTSVLQTNSEALLTTYSYSSGTSFAAPFVSGVAGLMLSVNSSLRPPELKRLIEEGAKNGGRYINAPDGSGFYVLNAEESVRLAKTFITVDAKPGVMGPKCLARLKEVNGAWQKTYPGYPIIMFTVSATSICNTGTCVNATLAKFGSIGIPAWVNSYSLENPAEYPPATTFDHWNPGCVTYRSDIFTNIGLGGRGDYEARCVAEFLGAPYFKGNFCSPDGFPIPAVFH